MNVEGNIKTLTQIVIGDREFGRATRAAEKQRLEVAAEKAFRDRANRDQSRNAIELALMDTREHGRSDLKAEAIQQKQRRQREISELTAVATIEIKRHRRVERPAVQLTQAERMGSDPSMQAILLELRGARHRDDYREARDEFSLMPTASALAGMASLVTDVQTIDARLALPFPDRPSDSDHLAIKKWQEEGAYRTELRTQRSYLVLRLSAGTDALENRPVSLEGLTPAEMLKAQEEHRELPAKVLGIVSPIIADSLKVAATIETALQELDAAWNGGPGGFGSAAALEVIKRTGEPIPERPAPIKPEPFLAERVDDATDPAKVLDRAIDVRLDAREGANT